MGPNYSSPELGPDPPPHPDKDACLHAKDSTSSLPENLVSPQRLSDAAITSCGAMRTSMVHVSEGRKDALSALKRTKELYRQTGANSSEPCKSDGLGRAQDVLMQVEQLDAGDRTHLPIRTPTAPASIVPAPQHDLTYNEHEQQATIWDPDDEEFDRWPGQET